MLCRSRQLPVSATPTLMVNRTGLPSLPVTRLGWAASLVAIWVAVTLVTPGMTTANSSPP